MGEPGQIYDACFASLVRCLFTVSERCPDLPADTAPLHRMRNLVQVLLFPAPAQGDPPAAGLSLAHALTLVSHSQNLFAFLTEAGRSAGAHSGGAPNTSPA